MPKIVEIVNAEIENFNNLKIEEDDEYEEEEEEEEEPVTLGFVEKPKTQNSILRHYFPSKAGGVPAWLDPIDLPSEKSRVCGFCGDPLQFLLQVYAPLANKESTFHRTLFVFMCPSMACLLKDQHEQWKRKPEKQLRSVKVFRCQLRRSNPLYSSEPPRRNNSDKPSCAGAALCSWCGTWRGDKVCSSCKSTRYCSIKHQDMHWRLGHKQDCQRMTISLQSSDSKASDNGRTSKETYKVASSALWPEFEILSEDESEFDTEASECDDSASLISKEQIDDGIESIMDKFEGDGDRERWASFEERIAKAPEQVLRYSRYAKAKPLWPMSSGRPSNADIPKCHYCDGPLCYEFQILPQLLFYFAVQNDRDSLDWATIVVYTCANSCETSISYKEEFAWVQISSSVSPS